MNSFKFFILNLILAFGLLTPSFAQYSLTVESAPAVSIGEIGANNVPSLVPENSMVYRFYVNMADTLDQFSAVFGNNEAALDISVPDGAFNSSFNASWSASGINPMFLPFFLDMADDTYATIGLTGPAASSGIAGAADPSLVEDSAQPIKPFFETNGSTELLSNTLTGASYYVLNTAGNSLPDADQRVLVMQITTTGSCLLYTSPSPRDMRRSRMPSSA